MKFIIFAGGTGRRLWPISRQKSPKQFEPILGEKSTVQLAVDRVEETYGAENIYVSTNKRYQDILRRQLPQLPPENVIGEPERRDLAPAVGLAFTHLAKDADPDEPVAILWGDNYMDDVPTFLKLLSAAEKLLVDDEADILFMGETPRYANENLGWIGLGDKVDAVGDVPYFEFETWYYRPPQDECRDMYESGDWVWNTGYFVTTVGFVLGLYEAHQPQMANRLQEIGAAIGQENYEEVLHRVYPQMEEISFDDAILTHVAPEQALVLHGEMGWSDPGTLYALKEALNPDPEENVEEGLVRAPGTKDSLLYNYEADKLMAAVGLEGMIVINTADVVLVVRKDDIKLVKQLVNSLEGTELEKYT